MGLNLATVARSPDEDPDNLYVFAQQFYVGLEVLFAGNAVPESLGVDIAGGLDTAPKLR